MRTKPYTEIGIARMLCFRCKKRRAKYQWNICSDGNQFRPICEVCDIALNRVVLRFMRFKNVDAMMKRYITRVRT